MKSLIFTIAFSLIAGAAVAQEKKGDVSSFYEKNTVLNYNEGNNPAGEIEQPTKFDPNFHIYLCFGNFLFCIIGEPHIPWAMPT